MPWTQEWLVPDQLVLVRFSGTLTYTEIGASFAKSAEFVNASTSDKRIHFLHDWTELECFPRNLQKIRNVLTARVKNRRKLGYVVMYGHNNPLLRFLSDVVFRLFKIPFFIFPTSDEAIAYLHQIDNTLPKFSIPPEPSD